MTSEIPQHDVELQLNYDFNSDISKTEVKRAISRAKTGKSAGIDETPTEVLKMTLALEFFIDVFLYVLIQTLSPMVGNIPLSHRYQRIPDIHSITAVSVWLLHVRSCIVAS